MAALSVQPLTPQNWLSAVGAIPRLVQLLHPPSSTVAQARATSVRILLARISNYHEGEGSEAAPDGVIPPLSQLLHHDDAYVRQVVAVTLSTLAKNPSKYPKIIEAGTVAPLVQLLKSSEEGMHLLAAQTLACLAESSDGRTTILAAGAIGPLLQLFGSGTVSVQLTAAMAVRILAFKNTDPAFVARAVPLLVQQLKSSSVDVQEEAAQALINLAINACNAPRIISAGALPLLVGLIGTAGSSTEVLSARAVTALAHLARDDPTFQQFVAAGAITPLVHLLRCELAVVQQRAMALLGQLAEKGRSDIFAAVESAGALPLLARIQTSASSEAMRREAETLLQALTLGTPPSDDTKKGSISAPSSMVASVHPASAAAPPSTASAALPPATASPLQQQQQQPLRPRKNCWSCGAMGVPLKKCSVCAVAAYCGAACQKTDWKAHKGKCAGMKAGATGCDSSAAEGK